MFSNSVTLICYFSPFDDIFSIWYVIHSVSLLHPRQHSPPLETCCFCIQWANLAGLEQKQASGRLLCDFLLHISKWGQFRECVAVQSENNHNIITSNCTLAVTLYLWKLIGLYCLLLCLKYSVLTSTVQKVIICLRRQMSGWVLVSAAIQTLSSWCIQMWDKNESWLIISTVLTVPECAQTKRHEMTKH